MMRRWILLIWVCCSALVVRAQQFTGTTGMIHVPTAEMNASGDARIGVHFIPREMTPDAGFEAFGEKYHTLSHYLSITPFPWVEIGYTCTLKRWEQEKAYGSFGHYNAKDRYFTLKLRPLKEGKYWPAIAIGGYDFFDTRTLKKSPDSKELYWGNFYGAATKHFLFSGHEVAAHIAYRYYRRDYNDKWEGVVGGLTYRPAFAPNLRVMVEYDGKSVNAGLDCLLWHHWLVQVACWEGKNVTGGICYQLNLF